MILLSGAGGHFSAGLDLHWLSPREAPTSRQLQHGLSDFQSAVIAIVRCPIPVLAIVQGTAAGFGFDLALACDMRLAGSSATFTSAFARMGLVPDGGSTFTLPRLVGVGRAMRVLMTDQTLDAAAALSIGLVEEVIEDSELEDGGAADRRRAPGVGRLQHSGHQAALPGARGRSPGAGAVRRGRGAIAGAAEPRFPPAQGGIHRARRRPDEGA